MVEVEPDRYIVSGNLKREGAAPGGKPFVQPFSGVWDGDEPMTLGELWRWAAKRAREGMGDISGALRIERDQR